MEKKAREKFKPWIPPITRRILAVNILALGILVAGLLYLGQYRNSLIAADLSALKIQAEMLAAALGEGAVRTNRNVTPAIQEIQIETARQIVRRLAATTQTRARLFGTDGNLLADSRILLGPGGIVQIEELPPPRLGDETLRYVLDLYDRFVERLPGSQELSAYKERPSQRGADYPEVLRAMSGETATVVRSSQSTNMILTVAVPVQRYKQVLGELMLSKGSQNIDEALFEVRQDIMNVFGVALGVTILLSVYLAGTIARPIHRLATAAEQIRRGHGRKHALPKFTERNDEIGELAQSLSDMTEALWDRMDAIESFAADVAHEIKNPLTSLNSAVETAARITDPGQQRKLMTIIQEDVRRLDRIISDIAEASRVDSELSREEQEVFDVSLVLETLVDMETTTDSRKEVELRLEHQSGLLVRGTERRLVQVFRNLIANAKSFNPAGGPISLKAFRQGNWIHIECEDSGPGLPPGKEDAIFERFYTERPKGEKFGLHSGLGLSISRQIIEAHQGHLHGENRLSAEGKVLGARFVIRLPAVKQPDSK